MTAKAPSRFAHATFAGVVVVAMTRAPKALAIWMPMDDRPPPAPCTRTVSPRRRRAFVTSMRYAVRAGRGGAGGGRQPPARAGGGAAPAPPPRARPDDVRPADVGHRDVGRLHPDPDVKMV